LYSAVHFVQCCIRVQLLALGVIAERGCELV